MSLIQPQLDASREKFFTTFPDEFTIPIGAALSDLSKFDRSTAIKVGDKLPEFTLPDAVEKEQSSAELLSRGPLVIAFYRGEWCPACNIAISGLQRHLAEFRAKGVTLVGITPQKPNGLLTMTEKHNLGFPVLSDLHNEYARKLGIVWKHPDTIGPLVEQINGIKFTEVNGDDSNEVPFPATLLVDQSGTVRNIFLEPDWTKRVEPTTVLEWINAL